MLFRSVVFPDIRVKFLRSERKELKSICETVSTGKWINVACAQLTTFYHARKNGFNRFWARDIIHIKVFGETSKLPKENNVLIASYVEMNSPFGIS